MLHSFDNFFGNVLSVNCQKGHFSFGEEVVAEIANCLSTNDKIYLSMTCQRLNAVVSETLPLEKRLLLGKVKELHVRKNTLERELEEVKSRLIFLKYYKPEEADKKTGFFNTFFSRKAPEDEIQRYDKNIDDEQQKKRGIKAKIALIERELSKTSENISIAFEPYEKIYAIFGGKESFENIPSLQLKTKKERYTLKIQNSEMSAPIMRGQDSEGRLFVAIRAYNKDWKAWSVQTIYTNSSNPSNLWYTTCSYLEIFKKVFSLLSHFDWNVKLEHSSYSSFIKRCEETHFFNQVRDFVTHKGNEEWELK